MWEVVGTLKSRIVGFKGAGAVIRFRFSCFHDAVSNTLLPPDTAHLYYSISGPCPGYKPTLSSLHYYMSNGVNTIFTFEKSKKGGLIMRDKVDRLLRQMSKKLMHDDDEEDNGC